MRWDTEPTSYFQVTGHHTNWCKLGSQSCPGLRLLLWSKVATEVWPPFSFLRIHREIKSLLACFWIKLEAELSLEQNLSCLLHRHDPISPPKLYLQKQGAARKPYLPIWFFKHCLKFWLILSTEFFGAPRSLYSSWVPRGPPPAGAAWVLRAGLIAPYLTTPHLLSEAVCPLLT